jgi:hypothetical protein
MPKQVLDYESQIPSQGGKSLLRYCMCSWAFWATLAALFFVALQFALAINVPTTRTLRIDHVLHFISSSIAVVAGLGACAKLFRANSTQQFLVNCAFIMVDVLCFLWPPLIGTA